MARRRLYKEQGERIRRLRLAFGRTGDWSQRAVAERLKVGLVTYRNWERGYHAPRPHDLAALAKVFGVIPAQIVAGDPLDLLEEMRRPMLERVASWYQKYPASPFPW